jgi:hypothetical protein
MRLASHIALLAAAAATLSACGGNDVADALNIGAPRARLVNAIPAGPSLQLYRNDTLQSDAGTPTYEQASKYFDTVTTTSTWSLRDASSGLQVGSTSMRVAGSTRYTLVAFAGAGTQADMVQISDPYNFDLGANKARVRVVNGSSNSGAIDLYLTAVGADLASATPVMSNVAYQGASPASGADSTTIGYGGYELRITAAGTKTVLFDGTLTARIDDDLLLVTLPRSSAAGDIKVLDIPSATDQANFEIPG